MIRFNELLGIEQSKMDHVEEITNSVIIKKTPWTDKYRPTKLDEIVYQDEVVRMLKKTLETGNLPHLLFYGPPGSGKTSSILAIAMELFGPRVYKDRVIELNASDERGINVVRNKIVTFAKTAIGGKDPRYPCPPYKIIILDEADAMTNEAQSALRKTMEDNSNITRFCFICNYINQIIEPITSRCVKFRFKPLNEDCMAERLNFIAKEENMNATQTAIMEITKICDGDLRKAIMFLQNLKYIKKDVVVDDIYEISGFIPNSIIEKIKFVCIYDDSQDINEICRIVHDIRSAGYPLHNILSQLNNMVIHDNKLTDKQKAEITLHFAKTEKRLLDGADEYLQLLSLLTCMKQCVYLQKN